jgi:hypothetical protein
VLVCLCPCGFDDPRNTLKCKLLQLTYVCLQIILFGLRIGNNPLQQVIPHPWRANNGKTQLRVPSPETRKLLELLAVLLLRNHQLSRTTSRPVGQAVKIVLSHLPGPVRLCMLTLEEGDLLDKAIIVFTCRCQCHDVLHLPCLGQLRLQHKRVRAPCNTHFLQE